MIIILGEPVMRNVVAGNLYHQRISFSSFRSLYETVQSGTKKCISKGVTDINDLTAILALRPKGAVLMSGKGMQYIKLTIANAIKP